SMMSHTASSSLNSSPSCARRLSPPRKTAAGTGKRYGRSCPSISGGGLQDAPGAEAGRHGLEVEPHRQHGLVLLYELDVGRELCRVEQRGGEAALDDAARCLGLLRPLDLLTVLVEPLGGHDGEVRRLVVLVER